jgi:hypothetical protein
MKPYFYGIVRGWAALPAAPVIGGATVAFGVIEDVPITAVRIRMFVDSLYGGLAKPYAGPAVFGRHTITSADKGRIFFDNAVTEPGFDPIAALLTNGVNDHVLFLITSVPSTLAGGGHGADESVLFYGPGKINGVDFGGQSITRLGLRIDEISFAPINEDFLAQVTVTVLVEGQSVFGQSETLLEKAR